jgi:hypothetical protein
LIWMIDFEVVGIHIGLDDGIMRPGVGGVYI